MTEYQIFINTLRPEQNGQQFTEEIFKCKHDDMIPIAQNFIPKGSIDKMSPLIQVIVWH